MAPMGADYSFELISIETYAPNIFDIINFSQAVCSMASLQIKNSSSRLSLTIFSSFLIEQSPAKRVQQLILFDCDWQKDQFNITNSAVPSYLMIKFRKYIIYYVLQKNMYYVLTHTNRKKWIHRRFSQFSKSTKNAFLPVFELTSDSLMTIWVEPHQFPSHQSILLIQGPIHEIFAEKIRELAFFKNLEFLDMK